MTTLPILPILPTLFKGNRQWTITINMDCTTSIEYGVVGGKMTTQTVSHSDIENAIKKAKSKHTAQIDRHDYHSDPDQAGKKILPMLALDYNKVPNRLKWDITCSSQPKLDGVRMIGGEKLLSRRGIEYKLPHILDEVQELIQIIQNMFDLDIHIDGEGFCEGLDIGEIGSLTRKKHPTEDTKKIKYYIFDMIDEGQRMSFSARYEVIKLAMATRSWDHLILVGVTACTTHDDLIEQHKVYVNQGYEGIMIRTDENYECDKRSPSLFKFKTFIDSEFMIVGLDRDVNGGGIYECETGDGDFFSVAVEGSHDEKQAISEDVIGSWLTVKYQNLSKKRNVPVFPVAIGIRECDEMGNPLV